jgi:hypothetical protein
MFFVIVAAALATQPAANSEAVADCILGQLSTQDRVMFRETVLLALDGSDEQTLQRELRIRPDFESRMERYSRNCVQRMSLTQTIFDQGLSIAGTRVVIEGMRVDLDGAGIPATAVDNWFDSLSETKRLTYGRPEMSDAELDALTDSMFLALESRGVPENRVREQAPLLGHYLAARAIHLRIQHGIGPG